MKFDLKSMTRKELEKLRSDVDKALDKLTKQDMKKAKEELAKVAKAHGFSLKDLVGGTPATPAKPARATKAKTAPGKMKYANPADPSQKWTGKGRQPNWFKDAIASGKTPESMEL